MKFLKKIRESALILIILKQNQRQQIFHLLLQVGKPRHNILALSRPNENAQNYPKLTSFRYGQLLRSQTVFFWQSKRF